MNIVKVKTTPDARPDPGARLAVESGEVHVREARHGDYVLGRVPTMEELSAHGVLDAYMKLGPDETFMAWSGTVTVLYAGA